MLQSIVRAACVLVLAGGAAVMAGARRENRLPQSDGHLQTVRHYVEESPVEAYRWASEESYEAFADMKYGIRIHWGVYSMLNVEASWPLLPMDFKDKQAYQQLYQQFNPKDFDAQEWMRMFERNGLKMFAFTTKHHDGFSMFDTATRVKQRVNWTAPEGPRLEDCDVAYSVMESPYGRDIVKELCDAAHKHGIKIDLYFSHPDWYDADFRSYGYHPVQTPDAKAHPERYGDAPTNGPHVAVSDPTAEEVERMVLRHRRQLQEIVTKYGKIDMVCLDMWMGSAVWPQMRQTMLALRQAAPETMFRARGIGNYGDYYTPEGFVPGDKENTNVPWFVIYPLAGVPGELFDLRAEITPGEAKEVGFDLRGIPVTYDVGAGTLTCVGLGKPVALGLTAGKIKLQILLDRTSIEIFGNDGELSMAFCFVPDLAKRGIGVFARGGRAEIASLEVYEMKSIWNHPPAVAVPGSDLPGLTK